MVEMGELETATRHLDSLAQAVLDSDKDELAYRKALLRLRIGDVRGAQHIIHSITEPTKKATLTALLAVANGERSANLAVERSR